MTVLARLPKTSAVRNPNGIWINTDVFRTEALHFKKYGYYCSDLWGTHSWQKYWEEQLDRCKRGYEVGGVKITGHHYFYLNFCNIELVDHDAGDIFPEDYNDINETMFADKVTEFPHFWDGDFNYFWALEIARRGIKYEDYIGLNLDFEINPDDLRGGKHMIVGKSRRKGYSYKNAAIAANIYNTSPKSITVIGAFDKKYLYPEGTMGMATNYINWLNKYTGWSKAREYVDKQDHRKASYKEDKNGIFLESGYQSQVMAVTFKDNPDAARGKDAKLVMMEEAGKFPNLRDSFRATEPSMMAGKYVTGQMVIFGCVCAGTKVWTHDGREINIENLKQEEGIIGYGGKGVIKEPIIWMKPSAKKPCYRIETEKGKFIECSNDHPLLVSYNHAYDKSGRKPVTFKKAEEIKVGDQLMSVRQVPVFGNKRMWNPRLVGLLIGDGNYTQNVTPQLSIEGEDIYEWLKSTNEEVSVYKQFQTKSNTTFRAVGIKNSINRLKLLGIYGQTHDNKHLPLNIHEFDLYSVQELIGGYFDADGSVNYNQRKNCLKITLTSKYLHLLEEVKTQLFKLNIGCSIVEEYRKGGYKAGIIYRLYITKIKDIQEFKKHIKFLSKHKQIILDNFTPKFKGRITYDNCLFQLNPDNNKGTFYLDNDNNHLDNLDSCFVKSVEYIGEKEVYNLNAGITHTYISNGFISGNTGGDMEKNTVDFSYMFYNPKEFNLIPFVNLWDDNAENTKCGFFHPVFWNMEGYYDEHGNSDIKGATEYELKTRNDIVESSGSSSSIQGRVQEYPLKPAEAFLTVSFNDFPVEELRHQLGLVKREKLYQKRGQAGIVYRDEKGKVRFKPDLKNDLEPLWFRDNPSQSIRGAVIIYEYPIPNPPKGLYKGGHDPYRQQQAESSPSLGATYIHKGFNKFSYTRDMIVAEYVGRPNSTDDYNRTMVMLCELYNVELGHENEVTEVTSYFTKNKKLQYLAFQPDNVINAHIQNSKVKRVYGVHMNDKLKDAGEKYIKKWLITVRDIDENGNKILNLNTIYSPALLEELIYYNRKGNFDRVMAFMILMMFIEEEYEKEFEDNSEKDSNAKDILNLADDLYRKN